MEKIVDFIYEGFEIVLFVGFIFLFIVIATFSMSKFDVYQDYIASIGTEDNLERYDEEEVLGAYIKTMIFEESGEFYIKTASGEIRLDKENYSSYVEAGENYEVEVMDANRVVFTEK